MTTIKLCADENKYLWAIALPDDSEDCENGPVLGPPEGLRKDVHNRLAEEHVLNAFDLMGHRPILMSILRDLGVDSSYAKEVTHIYQKQYFEKRINNNGD